MLKKAFIYAGYGVSQTPKDSNSWKEIASWKNHYSGEYRKKIIRNSFKKCKKMHFFSVYIIEDHSGGDVYDCA